MLVLDWLKKMLRKTSVGESSETRRVRIIEDLPSDRYVLIIALMIVFFVGLIGLEIIHMIVFRNWNDTIFNGIMLVVGTIVGAIWGRSEA